MARLTVHRGPDDGAPITTARARSACDGCRSSISRAAISRCPTRTARCGWLPTARSTTTGSCAASSRRRAIDFRTASDCETILHLYEEHGDDFVEHLNGMFAFALWDAAAPAPALGRDRSGIKPMYVWTDGTAPDVRKRGEGDCSRCRR